MKTVLSLFAYNEGVKIQSALEKCKQAKAALAGTCDFDVLVMDDGTTDGSLDGAEEKYGCTVLSNDKNMGIGYSIRRVINHARQSGYDILAIMAGNDKDDPMQITRIATPIIDDGFDFIQGSRYLPGGDFGNMPAYRQLSTRYIHPLLFSLITMRRFTDTTNGFRAVRLTLFDDPAIDITQTWLDKYELEPYIYYKAVRLGYKVKEVPVTKIYPARQLGYTKMKPITGWWSILRPLVFLGLGIRK